MKSSVKESLNYGDFVENKKPEVFYYIFMPNG